MAKQGKKSSERSNANTGGNRQMVAPFYNVVSAGKTIEWTDKLSEASTAFKDAYKPKQLWSINTNGSAKLINQVN